MNLDGKDKIKPTPFDAHEQVVRKPHTHDPEHGYQPVEEHAEVLADDINEEVVAYETSEAPKAHKGSKAK